MSESTQPTPNENVETTQEAPQAKPKAKSNATPTHNHTNSRRNKRRAVVDELVVGDVDCFQTAKHCCIVSDMP